VGPQFDRPRRGLLSRPSLAEVHAYRTQVDDALGAWLAEAAPSDPLLDVVRTGIHHEQQHQELILTDIKHVLSQNPLRPSYREALELPKAQVASPRFVAFDAGLVEIGHDGDAFCFDNERPRHRAFIHPFELASRPVTAGEYRQFIEEGGYQRPELWLSDGWATVKREGWEAPLYWTREREGWQLFTLSGPRPLTPDEPVCHVSYFEADAFARWAGARLPTELEWELAAASAPTDGNFVESGRCHPGVAQSGDGLRQMFGDVWEWTASAYAPYPGYRAPAGALGEYNGKFMCSQQVLRGGSCATPRSHIRPTYRNFFYPDQRWQFSGLRLARDVTA
jgi:ergothioneine biosynthesis protein EgtB